MKSLLLFLTAVLYVLLSSAVTSIAAATATNTSAPTTTICPLDLGYVLRVPWNHSGCEAPESSSVAPENNTLCCQTLLSLIGIAFARRLKDTSLFQLPDLNTSASCLDDYQSKLNSLSLPGSLVSSCFTPERFVINDTACAGIESTGDWKARLGDSTPLDSSCSPDLTDQTKCDACVAAGLRVQAQLVELDGNNSHTVDCWYTTILYAAGIVNSLGPESDGAMSCILSLSLESSPGSNQQSNLVFGLTGAGVAVVVMCCLLGLWFWYKGIWRRVRGGNAHGTHRDLGVDLEVTGSTTRLRPKAGSIWFKIRDLEKATDDFSQKNFIGRGGFGLAGNIMQVLDPLLWRDGEAMNSNPKSIMERFVRVGIMCSHVMVALRPTIVDALKMLEGDIEVPPIPDGPSPFGHPSIFSDRNTFNISPALSQLQLLTGDILR
ncbi:hypothetical protein SAY86_019033 [Trapa natans]|uniref:SPARK domain-containing protein n=1 Tax=Trapa natans TaxID=22666 RepID=A0AAN7LG18_TRANT|nr:hypothetical protein SAY86_019033 [Trapa natans]